MSAGIIAIHSSLAVSKERHQYLDMRDSQIFATQIQDAMNDKSKTLKLSGGFKKTIKHMATEAEKNPTIITNMRQSSPSVAEAMEMLNPQLSNL